MTQLTYQDLKAILAQCAGEDETVSVDGDVLDATFTDLGYDSLALLETAAVVTQRFGVSLSDDEISTSSTPRRFLDLVNGARSQAI